MHPHCMFTAAFRLPRVWYIQVLTMPLVIMIIGSVELWYSLIKQDLLLRPSFEFAEDQFILVTMVV